MTTTLKQAEVPISEVAKDGERIVQFLNLCCDGATHEVALVTVTYLGAEAEPDCGTHMALPLFPCDGSCQGWKNPSMGEARMTHLESEAEWRTINDIYLGSPLPGHGPVERPR